MWRIEFSSSEFLPYLPEESQGNPGVYGYELAHWLSRTLAQRGVITSYPLGEDWGWLIEYIEGDLEVTIGCSSMAEEGEGYSGKPVAWSVFVRPRQSVKKLFRRGPVVAAPALLTAAIESALAEKKIVVRHVDV
jgi:hypothetical protein